MNYKDKILEYINKFDEPFIEYYSHTSMDMWKWNYPYPKFSTEKIVICPATESLEDVYIKILEYLENIDKKNKIAIDRFRPYRNNLSSIEINFYDNLYISNKQLALKAFSLFYKDLLDSNKIFNLINQELIRNGQKVSLKKINVFLTPF